ncbi:MAG: hypothetical protein AB1512_30595 [Thermodesulfobacteriota bacterium]
MEVFLTEEEQRREENLFAPSNTQYKPLDGKPCDVRAFKEEVAEGFEQPEPPPSC